MRLINIISIPQYIDKVKTAEAIRPIYYSPKDKIPKKYSGKNYKFLPKKHSNLKDLILFDLTTNLPVIKNSKVAGKPRYKNIKGNDFYSGFGNYSMRNTIIGKLKDSLRPYFNFLDKFKQEDYPLYFEFIYYDLNTKDTQDLDNKRFAYEKSTLDLLQKMEILANDNVNYIVKLSSEFVEVLNEKDRELEIRIYSMAKSENDED